MSNNGSGRVEAKMEKISGERRRLAGELDKLAGELERLQEALGVAVLDGQQKIADRLAGEIRAVEDRRLACELAIRASDRELSKGAGELQDAEFRAARAEWDGLLDELETVEADLIHTVYQLTNELPEVQAKINKLWELDHRYPGRLSIGRASSCGYWVRNIYQVMAAVRRGGEFMYRSRIEATGEVVIPGAV